MAAGGYPAALARASASRASRWYRDYAQAIVERDVRDLARVQALDVLPRLLALAAAQTAHLINVSDLSVPFQLSRQTIRDYVTTIIADLDTASLLRSAYQLGVRRAGGEWQFFPAAVRD